MDSPPKTPMPSPPPPAIHDIPPTAERTAKIIGWVGWLSFWGQLIAGAMVAILLVIAIVSRLVEEEERVLWVGAAIFTAIAGTITLFVGTFLAFRLTRYARRIMLPYLKPSPSPDEVRQQLFRALLVSTIGLGISLLGTEISALSLLAKTLSHPQGAALYSPESTLRVLDVMVILITGSLAVIHFCGQLASYWPVQKLNQHLNQQNE